MKPLQITAAMDRRNGNLYLLMYSLIYLAAPVSYVGVVQAALCDRLGASAMIANLPFAGYLLGGFAPYVLSLVIPHRMERAVVIWSYGLTAFFIGLVFFTIIARLPPWIPISVLVAHGLLQGAFSATSQVFTLQCLARGMTEEGRNRTFKVTYFVTPICAVVGSLGAQYLLSGGLRGVQFPYDFALLYAIGLVCMTGITAMSFLFDLAPMPDNPRTPLLENMTESICGYVGSRPLVLLFLVYTLWYCALSITPNLSLYTRHVIGRDPKDFSGLIMALRFGCKSAGGYALGVIALRFGLRASVFTTSLLLTAGILWGWIAPGYAFLFAFGLLGAGELGGAYIPNYGVTLSSPESTARNVALLTLAQPVSSFSPALFGFLADRYGFGASFGFGLAMAVAAMWLTSKIRESRQTTAVALG